jgi:NAD(P)-dependent dehydrogenase (short-subunit alcohol dehydrogenase family)
MSRAIITTGASRGIGFQAALHLAERGLRSLGTVRRAEDADRLRSAGIEPILMDVTDQASIARAAAEVEHALDGGPLMALVNNAGVPAAGPIELADLDEARSIFEVNLFGVIAVTQAFLPLLRASGGRVVNMSSVAGRFTFPFVGMYSASKHALEAVSDALRRELRSAGVDVVLVEPGSIDTPIWDRVEAIDLDRYLDTPYERLMPMVKESAVRGGRTGLPAECVARAVHRAVTARRPPARIPVVASRFKWRMQRLVPAPVWDYLIGRLLARVEAGRGIDSPLR